ncbi:MAG TPA: host-nuclease inhibitor Gam family protein [Ignavibacteria bacterium]
MNEVNIICPHSPEINNVTEINPDEGLSLLPKQDDKAILEEIFEDIFEQIEADLAKTDSPEVVYAKFLWVIKMKVQAIEKIKTTAEKLIQDIQDWQDRKSLQHQGQIDFLSGKMEGYLRQQQLKSLQLPSGVVGLRKQQPKIEIVDSDKFYENADESILRKIPESFEPNLKAIKEKLKETGEIPQGVDVIEQDSKFYFKFN